MSNDDAKMPPGTLRFRRRTAGAVLAAALVAGCTPRVPANAQPARPAPANGATPRPAPNAGGVVMPAAMPCTDRDGDIAGLLLEGTGAPVGTVTVFGQAFRPGDVPRGIELKARLAATGQAVPVQLDVSRRHPDGSARFGTISLAAPAIPAGRLVGVVLSRHAAGEGGSALDLAELLDGRQILIELSPAGGQPWTADLAALARATGQAAPWQSGPLALQHRLEVPVRAGGITSLRLVADVAVRADRTLWVDAWLRNDISMQPGGGEIAYTLRILIDGREALSAEVPRHWQYGGWGRLLGGAQGGRAAPMPPLVRQDPTYLADTAAILPYDLTTGVDQSLFVRMARGMEDPGWATPLGPRGIETRMGAPGARPDLGQTTLWQAAWIITGDARAATYCIGQAEAAGSIPWHHWDPNGGDGRGGWLDVRRWPLFWTDPRGGRPPRTLLQPVATDTVWNRGATPSHQPDLSYVPYVLTGRRAFLDNLMAQAAWNVVTNWPANRRVSNARAAFQDVIIVQGRQTRSAAWSLRQIDEAAWISPDADPTRPYIAEVAAANWAWLRGQIPDWTARQGEMHGYIMPLNYGYTPTLAPWQQDYFASTAAVAARQGQEDAREFLRWMRNFVVGRFFAEAKGFPRHDAVAYRIALMPLPLPQMGKDPPAAPLAGWAEAGAASRERGISNGDGWATSNGEYARLSLLSLALTDHALDDERAREAYAWLATSGAPFTTVEVFARIPNHNVAARSMPRVPARVPRCTPSSASQSG